MQILWGHHQYVVTMAGGVALEGAYRADLKELLDRPSEGMDTKGQE